MNNVSTLEDMTERKQEALRDRRARKRERGQVDGKKIPKATPKLSDLLPPLTEYEQVQQHRKAAVAVNGSSRTRIKNAALKRRLRLIENRYDMLHKKHIKLIDFVNGLPPKYRPKKRKRR